MPASSWSGFSATTICMVEQLGLAMIPRWASSASGLTSLTTSGTSSCMRQREELSITVAPACANLGAHSPEVEPPAENSARSKPWIDSSSRPVDDEIGAVPPTPSASGPTERSDANATISRAGNPRSRSSSQHQRADLAGGADDGDPIAVARHRLRVPCRAPSAELARAKRPCAQRDLRAVVVTMK